MKIRVVGFQKTIGMPNFSNDKPVVVEADLEEGETMQEAWSKMNQAAIEWHKKEYSHLYPDKQHHSMEEVQFTPGPTTRLAPALLAEINMADLRTKDEVEDGIIAATTLEELTQWKEKAGTYGLVSKYMDKVKSLSK